MRVRPMLTVLSVALAPAALAQPVPRVDPAVSAVAYLGEWQRVNREGIADHYGRIRLVIQTFAQEHVVSRVYVQWLEQHPDSFAPRLVRTVRVAQPTAGGEGVDVVRVVGDTCAVLEAVSDHEDPPPVNYWLLRAGAPGEVRLRRIPGRGGERRYPKEGETDADRRAAIAACDAPEGVPRRR